MCRYFHRIYWWQFGYNHFPRGGRFLHRRVMVLRHNCRDDVVGRGILGQDVRGEWNCRMTSWLSEVSSPNAPAWKCKPLLSKSSAMVVIWRYCRTVFRFSMVALGRSLLRRSDMMCRSCSRMMGWDHSFSNRMVQLVSCRSIRRDFNHWFLVPGI